MARRHYTDEDRATALAALAANGRNVKRTARDTGVPESTLRGWAADKNRAGGGTELRARKKDEAADRWARVRDKALDQAEAALDAHPECADVREVQAKVTIVAVATEKHQLLSGGPTERLDHVGLPPVREVVVRKRRG